MKKYLAVLWLAAVFPIAAGAQNLIDLNAWQPGTGGTANLARNGLESENSREWGIGPNGQQVLVWKSAPDGLVDADGGWNSAHIAVNHTNMYRFSVWIKKTNSRGGDAYFGCLNVNNLDGTVNDNPYFWYGDLPELDRWYLLVGFVHGSGDNSTTHHGGIYDGVTGQKVLPMTDYKLTPGTTVTTHRSYLYYDPNTADRQYFYAPRLEMVNGGEPPLAALLGLQHAGSGPTYFAGKVGIKTTNPGAYDLAVNGKMRAHEVKVETANWPDYVFQPGYKLPDLRTIEKHIQQNGHLPGIPAARHAEADGVNLGEMNRKLLEKVEELTLYLIEANKLNKRLEKKLQEQDTIQRKQGLQILELKRKIKP